MKRIPTHEAELAELKRLWRIKQPGQAALREGGGRGSNWSLGASEPLGPVMLGFFDKSVQKRQPKLQRICDAWVSQVPEGICRHCSLESFTRGTLTVMIDTASHLYELKQLMLEGLERRLVVDCKSCGLRKIALKRGRWYAGEDAGAVRF